jgi:hypothetical protein
MSRNIEKLIDGLKNAGWLITLNNPCSTPAFNEIIRERFPELPADFLEFCSLVKSCTNSEITIMLLTSTDYSGISEVAFSWNEFEKESLLAAKN